MTDKQRKLLQQLDNVIMGLFEECEQDYDFNDYIAELEIFKMDLLEASCIINEELEETL